MNHRRVLLIGAAAAVATAVGVLFRPRGTTVDVAHSQENPRGETSRTFERKTAGIPARPSAPATPDPRLEPAVTENQTAQTSGRPYHATGSPSQIPEARPLHSAKASKRKSHADPDNTRPASGHPVQEEFSDTDPNTTADIRGDLPSLTVPFSPWNPRLPAGIPAALAAAAPDAVSDPASPPGLDQMTEEFLTKVSQGSQDPNDPAYQQLWDEAQTLSDARMKAAYGDAVWLKRHQDAYRQALGNTAPAADP